MVEERSIERTESREEVAATLRALASRIEAGKAVGIPGAEPPGSARLSDSVSVGMELEGESGEAGFALELEWEEPPEAASDTGDAVESLATFQLFRDRAAEWRWRLLHHNGNVIASSGEGYTTKRNALKGLRSVVRNAPGAEVVELDDEETPSA